LADGTLLYATLAADGWELRRARREQAGPPVAADRPVPFDSAPPVATRETGYAAWPSLRPHFWVPLFLDAGPSGRFWGGATAGTDVVGRFTYLATGLVAPQPFRALGSFAAVWSGLGNPTLDASASSTWDDVLAAVILSERTQEAALGMSFVARRWRTFASVRRAAGRAVQGRRGVVGRPGAHVRPGARRDARFSGARLSWRRAAGAARRDRDRGVPPAARARGRALRPPPVRRRQTVAQHLRRRWGCLGPGRGAAAHTAPLGGRRARRRPDVELRLLGAAPARRRRTAVRSPLRRGAAPAAVCGV